MTEPLPDSARLAWWATSWLRGQVVTDLALDAIIGGDATHRVGGLPGTGAATASLLEGLAHLRALGVQGLGLALPVEGDLVGLGGPRAFNVAALEVGEAVVAPGAALGLVPERVGAALTWWLMPAARRQLPDAGEADRGLRAALLETTDLLARLDVARWRPEVADELMNLRHRAPLEAPPGVPPRCVELAARARQAATIVELALEDDGGAITVLEADARAQALRPLAYAARRALVAACSPEVWPPA